MTGASSKRALMIAAATVICMSADAALIGFNQAAAGPWDYNSSANWVGDGINGLWDSSLTLTANQTTTFAADTTLSTGLAFNYVGGFSETLRGTGANRTLTLGGDVSVNTASNQTVTLGSTTANQNLNINLGGATRTFSVTGGGFGGNFGRTLVLTNAVSNGGIVASGGGTGGGKITLRNSANSLASLEVRGAELFIDGSGNSAVQTVDTVSGAFGIGAGMAEVTLSPHSTRNTLIQAGSFARSSGGSVLFRGTGLGANTIASATANSSNIAFTAAPTLQGSGTGTTIGIIAGAIGDSATTGNGLGATGGLVTYDSANGVRLLNTATEYTSAIVDQQTQLDNVRYVSTGTVQTTTLTAGTTSTINSLSFAISGATGTQGAVVTGDAGSTLVLNSGVIYASQSVTGTNPSAGDAMIISVPTLDLNGQEGVVWVSTRNNSGGTTSSNGLLRISSAITNANGLTLASPGGFTTSYMQLSGGTANTYSGVTTINGVKVQLNKSIPNVAIPGDLVINLGEVYDSGNQIADASNVTINGGVLYYNGSNNSGSSANETFATLTMNGGLTSPGSANGQQVTVTGALNLAGGTTASYTGGKLNVGGLASFSGGALTVNVAKGASAYDGVTTLSGGMAISNKAAGAYTPITINAGADATHYGGKLLLGGNVAFTGNPTNANTVTIEAPAGASQGVIDLNGASRTFSIGNGAADIDLAINAGIVNGGLVKGGAGTLALNGVSTYTGNTTISEGVLALGATGSIANSPRIEITAGASLDTSLQSFTMLASQTVAFGLDATGAGTAGLLDAAALDITAGSIEFATVGTLDDQAYVIASYTSLAGTFVNAPTVAGYQIDYAYQGNSIALVSAIPEPGTIALAGLVTGVSLLARRRGVLRA